MAKKLKEQKLPEMMYISESFSVHSCTDTGETYYGVRINGQDITLVMETYAAVHLHDREYLKENLIKYIKQI